MTDANDDVDCGMMTMTMMMMVIVMMKTMMMVMVMVMVINDKRTAANRHHCSFVMLNYETQLTRSNRKHIHG